MVETRTSTLVPASCLMALALTLLVGGPAPAEGETPIVVELKYPAPTAVARFEAQKAGQEFDSGLHRASIRLAQDDFLSELTAAGVLYRVTSTDVLVGGTSVAVPGRYTELINAVRLEAPGDDVGRIRTHPNVRHISVDEPLYLDLDRSAGYIRANGPESARSQGLRGTGAANCDGSATGQVVAVLDTGIDHTNPMFDSRFDDSLFEQRIGDTRPVRLQGSPFACDLSGNPVNHPKVAYRFLFAQAPVEGDDTGHGTNVASTAAGLKARADAILNNGEIVEGVAPGALLMDYKVCPSLVCNGEQILLALDDAAADTDLAGFPKPRATVVNMSFGNSAGDPNAANAIAAGNLQFLNTVPVASAGNSGPTENAVGNPSAGRLVISVAATNDPGVGQWSTDVLDPAGVDRATPGAVVPADGLATAPGERTGIPLFRMAGTPAPPDGGLAQYYVFVRNGQTIDEWPENTQGRIALVKVIPEEAVLPATTFGQIANNGALAGAVAVLFRSGTTNPTAVSAPIPAANIGLADADYLICLLSNSGSACRDLQTSPPDPDNGTLSTFPLRISPPGSLFIPNTAGFSSRGPNNDFGVVKPDITAPGVEILMGASKIGALGSPTGFTFASGTSFSSPHMAGSAALLRDALAQPDLTPSQVRAALMNSATNLRFGDQTTIEDDDNRNFIHETGAGLAELVRALDVQAVLGTNELNGRSGPDDPRHPNFLPSHSFGERAWAGTNLPEGDSRQQARIAVTLEDVSGEGGAYELSLVDAGPPRTGPRPPAGNGTPGQGDVTAPLTEPGFSLELSKSLVTVGSNKSATFEVSVAVDGTDTGLQLRCCAVTDLGISVQGVRVTPIIRDLEATEFLWYVVATRTDGTESLRMPFSLRVVRGQEGGVPVGKTTGGGWISNSDGSTANFGFNAHGSDPAKGRLQFDHAQQGVGLKGSVSFVSVSTDLRTATFSGPCSLANGDSCEYTVDVEDNAEPGKGADRFTIRWVTSSGQSFEASGLLEGGNIQVHQTD